MNPANRRREKRILLWSLLACLGLFVSCAPPENTSTQPTTTTQADAGAKYVGEWQGVSHDFLKFKIYKSGDVYILESNFPGRGVEKYAAVLRDGQMKVSHPTGETNVAYLAEADHLLYGGDEYRRIR